MIDADEALMIGLVERVLPHEELMTAAMDLAKSYAKHPPQALSFTVQAVRESLTNTIEEQLKLEWANQKVSLGSDEFKESVSAFVEKREAKFVSGAWRVASG